jgi:hypothetical protein
VGTKNIVIYDYVWHCIFFMIGFFPLVFYMYELQLANLRIVSARISCNLSLRVSQG